MTWPTPLPAMRDVRRARPRSMPEALAAIGSTLLLRSSDGWRVPVKMAEVRTDSQGCLELCVEQRQPDGRVIRLWVPETRIE
jgi:hypothetical protein